MQMVFTASFENSFVKGEIMVTFYETTVSLNPLKVRKDNKHYIVEDELTGDFYEMPEVCIAAIGLINQRKPLQEIEGTLTIEYPDEEINLLDFLNQLIELDLVSELNGEKLTKDCETRTHSGFTWIPEILGRFFFNPISLKVYFLLLVASAGLILFSRDLFPHYSDLFAFDLMLQNIVTWLVITFVLVLLHEFGHVLAVRSEGLPAKIEIGHRLFLVVLETDMSQVWKLPAEKRNKLYLAGMYFDSVVLFFALLTQMFASEDSLILALLKLVVLDTFIRLVYQAAVFMKTDLYYVIENKTGCYNLMENGRNFLARWLPFLRVPQTETFDGEERLVRTYAGFYLAGVLLTIAITAYYYIPQMIFAVKEMMVPGFTEPLTSIRFWDSVVFLLQIILVIGLLLYSWIKKYRFSS
jgi:putative peptide zinc metalloprotease protein